MPNPPVRDDLHRAATQLLAARTQRDVAHTAVRTVAHVTEADRSEVLERVDGDLQSRATVTFGRTDSDLAGPLETHGALLERVDETGMTGLVDDLAAVPTDAGAAYRSLLCVPFDGHGLLVAADREPGAFTGESVSQLRRLAELVAAALDRFDGGEGGSRRKAVAEVLSHDLQNVIAVANGRLELATSGDDPEQLEAVAAAHDRLLDMTDDLVTLLRTGDSVRSIEPVDLEAAARRAWQTIDTAEAELVVADAPWLMADHSSLCQLLENLFRNAIEHGGETVTVEVGALEGGRGFYVADDGPGIPPEDREAIFDLGYTTADRATGYGLAIVERIARAHGWDVEAAGAEHGGARFEVSGVIPLEAGEPRADEATPETRPGETR